MGVLFLPDDASTIYPVRFLPRDLYDADTVTAIAAVEAAGGTLTTAQKSACDTFIRGLKTESLWSKFAGLYLLVGGTSGAHAVNWKAPGTHNVTWVNSPTHDANGVTGNGSTAYGQTGVAASAVCPQNDAHVSVYNRSASPTVSGRFVGAVSTTSGIRRVDIFNNGGAFGSLGINDDTSSGWSGIQGFLLMSRTASNARHARRNTAVVADATVSVGAVSQNILILARSYEGFSNESFSNANLAFVSFGNGLTTTQSGTLNTLVAALQTSLGRNV